jgi:hypothetical protein
MVLYGFLLAPLVDGRVLALSDLLIDAAQAYSAAFAAVACKPAGHVPSYAYWRKSYSFYTWCTV